MTTKQPLGYDLIDVELISKQGCLQHLAPNESHMMARKQIISFLLFIIFIITIPSTTFAQKELLTGEPSEYRLYGSVLVADQPLNSKAQISLIFLPSRYDNIGKLYKPATTKTVSTNQHGEFEIRIPSNDEVWGSVTQYSEILLTMQSAGYQTVAKKLTRERLLVDLPIQISTSRCIALRVKFQDKNSRPLRGLDVKPAEISSNQIPFHTSLFDRSTTDEDGLVKFDRLESLETVFVSRGEINYRLPVKQINNENIVQLPDGFGTINGSYELPQGVANSAIEGKKVFVSSGGSNNPQFESVTPLAWTVIQLSRNGRFQAKGMIEGDIQVVLIDLERMPFVYDTQNLQSQFITAEQPIRELSYRLAHAKEFQLQFINDNGETLNRIHLDSTGVRGTSNPDGSITVKFADGKKPDGQIFPFDASGRYHCTSPFGVELSRVEMKNGSIAPIALTRSRSVQGQVVDHEGNLVAGAEVSYTHKSERFTVTKSVLSNVSGQFRIDGLAPNLDLKISAKKGNYASREDDVISVSSGVKESVTVQLHRQPTATIVGQVLTQSGDPIAGANVKLYKAAVLQEEGFGAESLNAVELSQNFQGVSTDENGNFQYPESTSFATRLQVVVTAPGFRRFRHPFINGRFKQVIDSKMDLGEFALFKLPSPVQATFKIVDANTNTPIPNAKIVCLGIDTGKKIATSDQDGNATLELLDSGQLLAVRAEGYDLSLDFVDKIADQTISLTSTRKNDRSLKWLEKPWQAYHEVAQSMISELDVPKPGTSTYYRQSTFLEAQVNADFAEFTKTIEQGYEQREWLINFLASQIFLNAPEDSIELIVGSSNATIERAILFANSALLSDDPNQKEELYGEAFILVDECSGPDRQIAAGIVGKNLVIDGEYEAAKTLIQEAWNSSTELKEQLKSKKIKIQVAESRTFLPLIALIDPDASIELIRLSGREVEVPGLLGECLCFASLAGHDAKKIGQEQGIELNIVSLIQFIELVSLSNCRYDSTARWIQQNLASMPDTSAKTAAIFFAARHLPEGRERDKFLSLATSVRKSCRPTYRYDDPAKNTLQELPKFTQFSKQIFDDLLFATIEFAPEKTDSMQLNGVYANIVKMVAVRDQGIARRLLDPAFENGAWLYGDPIYSPFRFDDLLKAYVWIDPALASKMALKLADQYAKDDPVRRLQLLTKVINELNAIAIRKGRLK